MANDLSGMKACIRVFGCQMNVYDGDVIADMLAADGCGTAEDPQKADIVILVTCSVRAHAEDRVASLIGTLRGLNPRPVLGLMGCTAQKLGGDYIKRFKHIDFVLGTHQIEAVVPAIGQVLEGRGPVIATDLQPDYVLGHVPAPEREGYFAYVPVARGCSRRCAYCIVPHVRGTMISREPDDILTEVRKLADAGYVEITLLGQNIDAYGKDRRDGEGLAGLLARVAGVPGLTRINFLTSHPSDFSSSILSVIQDHPRISPFFHLPPQSGSNSVLKAMGRGYSREDYLELIDEIYAALPYAGIAGDFIVGFPGESEADFEASADLLREVRFQQAYVFKYSPREGTVAAAKFEDTVPMTEKKRRNQVLLEVQEEIQLSKHREFIGQTVDIVVAGPSKSDAARYFGRTNSNFRVIYDPRDEHPGDMVSVRITSVTPLTLFGERI